MNIIYSVVGEPFEQWVKQRIEERNAAVVKEKNMLIDMDPEIAAAFANSTAVSCKCRNHFRFMLIINLLLFPNYSNKGHFVKSS